MDTSVSISRARYIAFLSYRHRLLPQFVRQFELALKQYAKPLLRPPIKIFRDENHLTPGVDLPQLIRSALMDSEFLILLASPEAAASEWVRDEISYWCGILQRTQNLIIVLLDGEIACTDSKEIDWDRTDALPHLLREHLPRIPFYVDMRWAVQDTSIDLANAEFKRVVNLIIARMKNLDPNDMLGIEVQLHRKNMRLRNLAVGLLGVLTVTSLIATGIAFSQKNLAALERDSAIRARNTAEERRRAAVMITAAGEIDQGNTLAAYNRTRADEGLPVQFRRNVALTLFETGTVVDASTFPAPDEFDVDELQLSSDGTRLITQGWYHGVHLIDLAAKNSLSYCGSSFRSMSLSPSGDSLVLQDKKSVQLLDTIDCEERGAFHGSMTTAEAVDGPLGMIVGTTDGRVHRLRADGKSLEPLYATRTTDSIVATISTPRAELIALKSSRDVLRLIDHQAVPAAPDLRLVRGRFLKTRSPQWSAFVRALPLQSQVRLVAPPLGGPGRGAILAFFAAKDALTWVGFEKNGADGERILAARLTPSSYDGCTWLEWLTPTALHRVVADQSCLEKGDSTHKKVALPVVASSGAFCGPDYPFMLGTADGAILWARLTSLARMIAVEHVERSWTDSVTALVCTAKGTAYAGFRATGVKRYQSRFRVVTERLNVPMDNAGTRIERDKTLRWNLRQPVEGATLLQLRESGTLQLSKPKQTLWSRQVARTIPYRTGRLVDSVDGVAIDEARSRVWVMTSYGNLILLDLRTGVTLATVGTVYWAASPGMSIRLSGILIDPNSEDITFTSDSWKVHVSLNHSP